MWLNTNIPDIAVPEDVENKKMPAKIIRKYNKTKVAFVGLCSEDEGLYVFEVVCLIFN